MRSASQVFKSEALMISAIKALGSTFAMARAPSPAQLLVGHRDLVDGTASLKQLGALRNSRRLSDGNDGSRHFEGRFLGLVGDQLAQEWNEYDERDAYCEAADAKFGEQFRVTGIRGDGRGAGRVRDHSRKVTCEQ